jgi:hypothetical protein
MDAFVSAKPVWCMRRASKKKRQAIGFVDTIGRRSVALRRLSGNGLKTATLVDSARAYRKKKRAERPSPHIAVCPHPWTYALNFRREL